MPVTRPYRLTNRQFVSGDYGDTGDWRFIEHPEYAKDPLHYIRAFNLIQKDLLELFDYVEPSDSNLATYSYRIHQLHLRACIEVEAHFKTILSVNSYRNPSNWTMRDYSKLEITHRLSGYEVQLPIWRGKIGVRRPFAAWASGARLNWYQAYNAAKHDRQESFEKATFNELLDAVCALVTVLAAQFASFDFSNTIHWMRQPPPDGFRSTIGGHFLARYPSDWPAEQRYDFSWEELSKEQQPFQTLTFSS